MSRETPTNKRKRSDDSFEFVGENSIKKAKPTPREAGAVRPSQIQLPESEAAPRGRRPVAVPHRHFPRFQEAVHTLHSGVLNLFPAPGTPVPADTSGHPETISVATNKRRPELPRRNDSQPPASMSDQWQRPPTAAGLLQGIFAAAPVTPNDGTANTLFYWLAGDIPGKDAAQIMNREGNRRESLPGPVHQGVYNVGDVVSPSNQRAWLASESNWSLRVGENFTGTKVLGVGGFGVVGLWVKWTPNKIFKLVVKQSGPNQRGVEHLKREAEFLKLLGATSPQPKTKHIIKMYGFGVDEGQGTDARFDPQKKQVGRLYLEFCQGGDLLGFLESVYQKYTAKDPMPENLIWRVFKCLALALSAMETGYEEPSAEEWKHNLIHFDIKPENIFLGGLDQDHEDVPICKIGDLGLMANVNLICQQDKSYDGHGTREYFPPEQSYSEKQMHKSYKNSPGIGIERKLTTAMNVWQVGSVMWRLVCRSREPNTVHPAEQVWVRFSANSSHLLTMGREILEAPYSVALRSLVLKCMCCRYTERPKAKEIIDACNTALEALAEAELIGLFALGLNPIIDVD